MILWIILAGACIIAILVALRLWRIAEEEYGIAEYWRTNSRFLEQEVEYWKSLYEEAKQKKIIEGEEWKYQ